VTVAGKQSPRVKDKLGKLLRKMLETPPLPKSEVKVANPKPKKESSTSASQL
jgi:hypothetical protein